MPFVEHNDVIEAFPSNRPDDAFSEGVLPGRSSVPSQKSLEHSFGVTRSPGTREERRWLLVVLAVHFRNCV